jgi:hypothetical protein
MADDAGHKPAPPWHVSRWFNTPADGAPSIESLRGKVIALHAFQMLCPGCVSHGVPQTQRIHDLFADRGVAVIGLHTVFEHHDAMTPIALAAFLHEYRVSFPVGVDEAGTGGPLPRTMEAYGLRGTPSLVLIDRRGRLRAHAFGQTDDLAVGMELGRLLSEPA